MAFTLSMQALVLADDLVLLFICWELTSLASFLLIASAGNAGEGASMRTLLITFVGGVLLLLAIAAIWWRTGTTSLSYEPQLSHRLAMWKHNGARGYKHLRQTPILTPTQVLSPSTG